MPTMDVTIEKLIYGGEGLAHHEGSTVFVPFVLTAERAAILPTEQKKKFIRARLERVLDVSPERIAPRCPHFGVCGGCDYQHIPYEAQLKYKTEILRETLRRIPHRMGRRSHGSRIQALELSQSRAMESSPAQGFHRGRGSAGRTRQARHRLL